MNREDLNRCLDALPADVRRELDEQQKRVRGYLARAVHVRERLCREFPNMNPKLRAAISLAVARIL
jgi:hypothetical protein